MKVTTDEVRRTLRTTVAVVATLAALVPVLVELGVIDESRWPWVGTIVVVAAAITRGMQNPTVDGILQRAGIGRDPRVIPGEVVDSTAASTAPGGVPSQDPGAPGDL